MSRDYESYHLGYERGFDVGSTDGFADQRKGQPPIQSPKDYWEVGVGLPIGVDSLKWRHGFRAGYWVGYHEAHELARVRPSATFSQVMRTVEPMRRQAASSWSFEDVQGGSQTKPWSPASNDDSMLKLPGKTLGRDMLDVSADMQRSGTEQEQDDTEDSTSTWLILGAVALVLGGAVVLTRK